MIKKKNKKIIEYSREDQELFLSFLMSNHDIYIRSSSIVEPIYWDPEFRSTVSYIKEYVDKNNVLPTKEMVKAKTGKVYDVIEDIKPAHVEDVLNSLESFCRHKSIERLILDGPDLLESGDYYKIEERCRESMLISLQRNLGTDYFEDPYTRIQRMNESRSKTPTGWVELDQKLDGGFGKGELSIFSGLPNSGKSLFLQNISINFIHQGLNVIYITLEMSEDDVNNRIDAMILDMKPLAARLNPQKVADELAIKKKTQRLGQLYTKKMPDAGTRCLDLRVYLKEFEIKYGFKPDVLVIDYLDLLDPNSVTINLGDHFTKDKYVSQELRGIASEYDIICVSASQLNRSGVQESTFDFSHIAGGISKINTVDNAFAIYRSESMKQRGMYQLQLLKTRSSGGVGSKVLLSYNLESLRITDYDESLSGSRDLDDIEGELADVRGKSTDSNKRSQDSRNMLLNLARKNNS